MEPELREAEEVKHGKKPTVAQRKLLEEKRFQPGNWLIIKDTPEYMLIRHRYFDGNVRTIRKKAYEDVE